MPEDRKIKKEVKTIKVSPHLSIDSPMVIHFVEGLESGEPKVGAAGRGGGIPADPVDRYVAVCNEFHPADPDLGIPPGPWMGPDRERYDDALGDASVHANADDTLGHSAYVALFAGNILIGPVKQH